MIVDAHLDIASNVISAGRAYTDSIAAIRAAEGPREFDNATVALPDALAGGVGLVFGTLFVAPADAAFSEHGGYHNAEEASQQALDQLAVYRSLA